MKGQIMHLYGIYKTTKVGECNVMYDADDIDMKNITFCTKEKSNFFICICLDVSRAIN